MKNPTVSVIIGTYNCEKYITETVNSVINQTFKDWELIVVDDCSTDNTYQKLQEIHDARIKIIRLEKNSGLPAIPRNIAIRESKGDYIAFLDHDDLWLPHKLEKQVNFMKENEDVFLVYTRCYVQKNEKNIQIGPLKPKEGHIFKDLYLSYNIIPVLTVMLRNKKGLDRYLFDESREMKAVEDYDLWLRISYQEKISYINEPLAIYRLHSHNTSSGDFYFFKKFRIIMEKYSNRVSKIILIRKYCCYYWKLFFTCIIVLIRPVKRLAYKKT